MVDLHSHILYGIDDGSNDFEESINIIKNLKEIGFNSIILTSHYLEGSEYMCDNKKKKSLYKEIKKCLEENNIDINLYLGNEVYMNDHIHELVMDKKIYTINNSRYILIELPLYNELNNLDDYLFELKLKGYIPIIAHPERYEYYQDNYKELKSLKQSGVLFQSNYSSIAGKYGKECMKTMKYLLENELVDFLGTDVHSENTSLFDNFDLIKNKIISYSSKEYFEKISNNNALKVINDELIED